MKIEGMPISRAVKIVLETIVAQQEKLGTLDRIDAKTAEVFLENHSDASSDEPSVNAGVDFGAALRSVAENENREAIENSDGNVVERMFQEGRQPSIAKPIEVSEEEEEYVETRDSGIWAVPYMPLADILEVAPDDVVVKKFIASRGDKPINKMGELLQRCIEVVYKRVDSKTWGTPAVHKMVENLFQDNM
jgi:hypothetical protein